MEYSWPLSKPQFTWMDKLKFAKFILTNDRWTQGKQVEDFEFAMADYVGVRHALFTSSGSTANTLLAMYLQDNAEIGRDTIVFPSTTWITSVSPFLREGFQAEFIDVNLDNFSIDLVALENFLAENHKRVACVFVTSLIGFTPDIEELEKLSVKYGVKIMMDNCENTLGKYKGYNLSSYFTSTTSTYFGHQIQSIEGGFIFTNDEKEYEYFLMARNHGMLRHLPKHRIKTYRNPDVDERFDFHMLGNNFRNSNLHAFAGLCDLKRADQYFNSRRQMYALFSGYLKDYLILPQDNYKSQHAPFCLPVVLRPRYTKKKKDLERLCRICDVETRPIISGNLLRQKCLARPDYRHFLDSEYLHHHGFYIGLHGSTQESEVRAFCELSTIILKGE